MVIMYFFTLVSDHCESCLFSYILRKEKLHFILKTDILNDICVETIKPDSFLHHYYMTSFINKLPPPKMMRHCCPLNLGLSWGTYCSWPHFYDSYHCDLLCHSNYKRQRSNSFLSDDPTSCILRTSTYFCAA